MTPVEESQAILEKCPTGIKGLDEILDGGIPRGRSTLICGFAGSGKTLMGIEFLVHGAAEFDEPGVCLTFGETAHDLEVDVASLGLDLAGLVNDGKILIDYVDVNHGHVDEVGSYDLEGVFVRLEHMIAKNGAKRVLIDTIEEVFAGLGNERILRRELRRLFRWLNDRGLTVLATAERGVDSLTRRGLEEYISDCVILLDHTPDALSFVRNLRVVKYRGSRHGTREFPFLIDQDGIWVFPVTSLDLKHPVGDNRISSGVEGFDRMLDGGYFEGSSILVSGAAGVGKSSVAAHFAQSCCSNGERVLYFSFEESVQQSVRNMKSIGLDLGRWLEDGLLRYESSRPSSYGVEKHLVRMSRMIEEFQPAAVIIDPITSLTSAGAQSSVYLLALRLIDTIKSRGATCFMTGLASPDRSPEQTFVEISSLIDTWVLLRDLEFNGERNRTAYVLKSRGSAHSNQVREFLITKRGIRLLPIAEGAHAGRTGSTRVALQQADQVAEFEAERAKVAAARERDLRRKQLESEMRILNDRMEDLRAEAENLEKSEEKLADMRKSMREAMAVSRGIVLEDHGLAAARSERGEA